MAIPPGYLQLPNALWVRISDASGPYMIDSAGTVTPFTTGPPPAGTNSLDFSKASNSMYLALISVGGL